MSPAPISSAAAPAGPTGCMTGGVAGGAGDCGVRDDGVEVGTFSVHVVSNSRPSIRTASPTLAERDLIYTVRVGESRATGRAHGVQGECRGKDSPTALPCR